jgi:hypothetical protein
MAIDREDKMRRRLKCGENGEKMKWGRRNRNTT